MSTEGSTQQSSPSPSLVEASSWGAGKLILFGEHAVVYGHPAVAVALSRGLEIHVCREVSLDANARVEARLSARGRLIDIEPPQSAALLTAFHEGLRWASERGLALSGVYEFTVEGALPFKVGLGSSAALSVASLRAIAKLHHHHFSDAELFEGALSMERVFHQNPSGLDHQVSIQGGALMFKRSKPASTLEGEDHAKGFTQRSLNIGKTLHLVLSWTPREGSTADAVSGVAARRADSPYIYDTLFYEISEITKRGITAIEFGDLYTLSALLNDNHQRLIKLGVSTPALNQSCERLLSLGALGAKMSGAGQGGTSFGLFESEARSQAAALSLQAGGHQALALSLH
jgi:mevalonate kinase